MTECTENHYFVSVLLNVEYLLLSEALLAILENSQSQYSIHTKVSSTNIT